MNAHSPPPVDSSWLIQSANALDKLDGTTDLVAAVRAVAERRRVVGDSSDLLPPAAQQISDQTVRQAVVRDPDVAADFDATVGLFSAIESLLVSDDDACEKPRRWRDTEPDPTS